MFGFSDTITGAIIAGVFGFGGLLIGLIVNSILEKRRTDQQRLKDIRSRLIGDRLLATEVMEFVKLQRKRIHIFNWAKMNQAIFERSFPGPRQERNKFIHYFYVKLLFLYTRGFLGRILGKIIEKEKIKGETNRPDLSWAKLDGIKLRMQDLNGIVLFHAELNEADLWETKLSNADLRNAKLTKSELSGADLSEANLTDTDFCGSNMMEINLCKANFYRANLSKVYLDGGKLVSAGISSCDASLSKMIHANLEDLGVYDSNFENVDFSDSNLVKTHFFRTKISGAVFRKARLYNTYFEDVDLSNADFTEADMQDVVMINVKLNGAKIDKKQLDSIALGENVILPNGKKKYFPPEIVERIPGKPYHNFVKYSGKLVRVNSYPDFIVSRGPDLILTSKDKKHNNE